jgi:ketosteroid isomerase-like protein
MGSEVDVRSASAPVTELLARFFAAKSDADLNRSMEHFHPSRVAYHDAVLGWHWPTHEALRAAFAEYMPQWGPDGKSYENRVIGDERSAVVMFTNTPQLFGSEIQSVASVTFDDGRIVRWVDYWDGRHFGREQAAGMRVPDDQFPGELGAETTTDSPDVRILGAATELMGALTAADPKRVTELLTPDAVWEDLPLHLSLHGRTAVGRFLAARGRALPYGPGAAPLRVVGGGAGGGVEWLSTGPVPRGILAFELQEDGLIWRVTAQWDGSRLPDDDFREMVLGSIVA